MTIRTLIVDDVELARERIVRMLGHHDDVEIVGHAADGMEATSALAALTPDLLILDIAMPRSDGLSVARGLAKAGSPAVIFVTAHREHALPAFEVAALDYLMKPVSTERLAEALERVRAKLAMPTPASATLLVPDGPRTHYVAIEHIDYVEATGHYLVIHVGGETYLLREPLSMLAGRLGFAFLRIHRSVLVRIDRIVSLNERRNGDATAVLSNGRTVRVSRTYRPALAARLERRCR